MNGSDSWQQVWLEPNSVTKWIALGAVVITIVLFIVWAALRDMKRFRSEVLDEQIHTVRGELLEKYIIDRNERDPFAESLNLPEKQVSQQHYMVTVSIPGRRRPIRLEAQFGLWSDLPETGKGLVEYTGGALVSFSPEADAKEH